MTKDIFFSGKQRILIVSILRARSGMLSFIFCLYLVSLTLNLSGVVKTLSNILS